MKLSIKKISFIPALSCILLFSLFLTLCTPPHSRIASVSVPAGKRGDIIRTAEKYLGTRYRYGGSDPRGFDCSGLVFYVFKQNGFVLPRGAGAQFEGGKRIPINRAMPGDLVFFRISGSNISHVGIYAGNFRFLHSPSTGKRVRYDDIRKKYWRTRYAGTATYFK